jgi:Secretion system C-terminal sorting domain
MFAGNGYSGLGEWTTPLHVVENIDASSKINTLENIYLLYDELVDLNAGFIPVSNFNTSRVGTAMDASNPTKGKVYCATKPYNAGSIPGKVWMWNLVNKNWKNVSAGLPDSIYATDIAIDKTNDSIAYITYSSFTAGKKVFKTKNAGTTWLNVSDNLPNIPVNAVVCDSSDIYHSVYIGTDVGVYKRNDTMKNWLYFSKNLPNVIVSDLEIHPQNHKLIASTFGRSMWVYDLPNAIKKVNAVNNLNMENYFKIMNPVSGTLNIQVASNIHGVLKGSLLNQLGQSVFSFDLERGANQFSINSLNTGIYFLKLNSDGETIMVEKIIVE